MKLVVTILLLLMIVTVVGCKKSQSPPTSESQVPSAPGVGELSEKQPQTQAIPLSFFGMVSNRTFPIDLPYGNWRLWDTEGTNWTGVEICKAASGDPTDACFLWKNLDQKAAIVYGQGVKDGVMYTLSRSPAWAVDLNSDPTGNKGLMCNFYKLGGGFGNSPGQCLMPTDLNSDGSGTNKMWKDWVTAIVTHVNDKTYLQTHPHIMWWEPWNEVNRGTLLATLVPPGENYSFEGTYAQLVRMTEDLKCIVQGKGTIHNTPTAGKSTACTNAGIDPTAKISASSGGTTKLGTAVVQNFLYCDNPPVGSGCTTGTAGSDAVDGINYHLYSTTTPPEDQSFNRVPTSKALLHPADQLKPYLNGEGSWGDVSKPAAIWKDKYAQAGFIPRYYATYWTANVFTNFWYAFDEAGGTGGLSAGHKLLHPQSDAWITTLGWLVGSTPENDPFCSAVGTIYTCDMVNKNGNIQELVWDVKYGQNCSSMSNPVICGNTTYPTPVRYSKDWIDVVGAVHPKTSTVMIGANPILLEGGPANQFPTAPQNYNVVPGVL